MYRHMQKHEPTRTHTNEHTRTQTNARRHTNTHKRTRSQTHTHGHRGYVFGGYGAKTREMGVSDDGSRCEWEGMGVSADGSE